MGGEGLLPQFEEANAQIHVRADVATKDPGLVAGPWRWCPKRRARSAGDEVESEVQNVEK